jgi:pyochelin biosynthesis protein PchC
MTIRSDPQAARASSSHWLHEARPGTGSERCRLVFFPPAGGSASAAWELADALPADWSVWGVQYPGRGPRLREPLAGSIREIAEACLPGLRTDASTTVLFGHSFGAFVAYDVAQLLQKQGLVVAGLLVAGVPAPNAWHAEPVSGLTDEALAASLVHLGGTSPDLAADDELLELVLPALRADLDLGRSYVDDYSEPLAAGIYGLTGQADQMMTIEMLLTWRHRTSRWLGYATGDGGHFFYLQERGLLADVLTRQWPTC